MNRTANFLNIIIKGLILVAIIAVGILIYSTCSGSPLIKSIDKTLPGNEATFEIPTVTRTYIAHKAKVNDDGSVTITDWYQKEDSKWVFYEGEITLLQVLKPRIQQRKLTK